MNMQPKVAKRFQKRLDAMINRSDGFKKNFKSGEPIYELLNEFSGFSKEYIELLKSVPESISRNSYVVNNGIEKLLQEWNILSRASEQRLIGDLKENLDKASELAREYCRRWNDSLKDNSYHKLGNPVVYFEKLYRISLSIYAPQIPVISIPLSDFDQPENWQSLAHEFSHHIFWNGFDATRISRTHQKIRESISAQLLPPNGVSTGTGKVWYLRQLAERVELWENWLEEVFADVYGTLLAGFPYATSAQDLMAEQINVTEDFLIADHDHPCIYLRPLLSLYALDIIADQAQIDRVKIDTLKKRWADFSYQASQLKYNDIPLDILAEDAKKVVDVLLHGGYWPVPLDSVKLPVDLVAIGDRSIQPIESISDLGDPLTQKYPALESVKLPDKFEKIKDQLIQTSTPFIRVLGGKQPDEETKLQAWLSLTGLELSDIRGYPVHGCSEDHRHLKRWWYKRHYHSQDGSDIFSC